jgi:hypothetical protein
MANEKDHGPRLGADPELFVQDAEGTCVPVCGKIGGTKAEPIIINHLVEAAFGPERGRPRLRGMGIDVASEHEGNYAMQEDNVMLEFNVPAHKDGTFFVDSINKALNVLEMNVLLDKGLRPRYEVMHTFKAEDIAPFPQAFTVGCMADMNAYAEDERFERHPFEAAHFGNHRFCGGHLHVQYNHGIVPRHIFAQFMDIFAELPFMRWDKQKMRRLFYGQPGLYREKPYGIEYRTTSNFWLTKAFREKWLGHLADNVIMLAKTANTDPEQLRQAYGKIDWSDVQKAIRDEDVKLADEIVNFVRNKIGLYVCSPASR